MWVSTLLATCISAPTLQVSLYGTLPRRTAVVNWHLEFVVDTLSWLNDSPLGIGSFQEFGWLCVWWGGGGGGGDRQTWHAIPWQREHLLAANKRTRTPHWYPMTGPADCRMSVTGAVPCKTVCHLVDCLNANGWVLLLEVRLVSLTTCTILSSYVWSCHSNG